MRFYFHRLAEQEIDEAAQYYEERQVGLGLEFAEEVYATVQRISEYPDAWSEMSKNTRRCLVNRFPYGVIFQSRSSPACCASLLLRTCIDGRATGRTESELNKPSAACRTNHVIDHGLR